jgi:hypothetical protein
MKIREIAAPSVAQATFNHGELTALASATVIYEVINLIARSPRR